MTGKKPTAAGELSKQTAGQFSDLIANLRQQPTPDSETSATPSSAPAPAAPPQMPDDTPVEEPHQQGSVTVQNESSVPDQPALSSSSPKIGASVSAGRRPRGRPRQEEHTGKRSHPDYGIFGAYIRKDTRNAVQRILLEQNFGAAVKRDFSDLVEELLQNWVARTRKAPKD